MQDIDEVSVSSRSYILSYQNDNEMAIVVREFHSFRLLSELYSLLF